MISMTATEEPIQGGTSKSSGKPEKVVAATIALATSLRWILYGRRGEWLLNKFNENEGHDSTHQTHVYQAKLCTMT